MMFCFTIIAMIFAFVLAAFSLVVDCVYNLFNIAVKYIFRFVQYIVASFYKDIDGDIVNDNVLCFSFLYGYQSKFCDALKELYDNKTNELKELAAKYKQ